MKPERKYREYPYKAVHPQNGHWYAFYRINGMARRQSLKTRNERIAEKRFHELCERLDKGILGFSLKPKPLRFEEFARTYLCEGTADLAPASILRHRQNLFATRRTGQKDGTYLEEQGHLTKCFGGRDFKSIGVKDVIRYINSRLKAGAAANTILKELATLSAMFQYALREELVLSNPVLAVKKPKLRLVRPNYAPSREELELIFRNLYPGARRLFLAFCNSGCRRAELSNCNVGDALLDRKLLRVTGKGGKERLVPMNDVLHAIIADELSSRPPAKPLDPLFLNREGGRYQSMRTPLTRACEEAGVPHVTHHGLRHAYATLQYDEGQDLILLSRLLGHANPTVTQNIYIRVPDQRLRKAAESFKVEMLQKSSKSA